MTLSEFVVKYHNVRVDFDKLYGATCVDLYRQYLKDVIQIDQTPSVVGAKQIWERHGALKKREPYAEKAGDILVWDGNSSNPYGHVAICLGTIGRDLFIVLEGDGYQNCPAKLNILKRNKLLGALYY